jgi:hypothetical protein
MEVSGQLHNPAALPPGKEPLYPLERRLRGHQSRSGHGGEEKIPSPEIKNTLKSYFKALYRHLPGGTEENEISQTG